MNKGRISFIYLSIVSLYGILMLAEQNAWLGLTYSVLIPIRIIVLLAFGYFVVKQKSLTAWILYSMFLGTEVGHDIPDVAIHLNLCSKIFLKLIKTIIAPLIFATLVVGIAGHSNLKQVGRMGLKAILYFEIVTTFALFIGLFAINITEAGVGIEMPENAQNNEQLDAKKQSAEEVILHIFPDNIAKSIAEGQILQIVLFSILFAIGLALVSEAKRKPMLDFTESLAEVMFKFTKIVMYFAPIGVGAAIAYTVSHMGLGILVNLFQLLVTLYGALLFFLLFVLLPVAFFAKVPLKKFLSAIAEPVSIAFATTSSEAALPKAMENMEKFGVPRKIVAFVLPTGYSFNLDGTTLYLSLASVFVAQAAGIDMTWKEELMMVFTLMVTSKGVAGVPRASLVILLGTAASFGLPVEPIFLILGIDELMDMARTSINVIGNCLATVVIAKWEGEYNESVEFE